MVSVSTNTELFDKKLKKLLENTYVLIKDVFPTLPLPNNITIINYN